MGKLLLNQTLLTSAFFEYVASPCRLQDIVQLGKGIMPCCVLKEDQGLRRVDRTVMDILWKKLLAFLSDFNVGCAPKPGCILETALLNTYHLFSSALLYTQRH